MTAQNKVYNYLDELNIQYLIHNHEPIFTMEEGNALWAKLPGLHCKNLFFRNKKGNKHYLVVMHGDKQLNIKDLEQKLGAGRLSFASKERLKKHLDLQPGSVTPFGLINNTDKEVIILIDEDLQSADQVNFHPNDNSATVTISAAGFKKYLEEVGNEVKCISI